MSLRIITREDNSLYLKRWAVRAQKRTGDNGWRVYLHRFFSGDGDGHHNHPWHWSFSIVLWGSYTEEYFDAPKMGIQRDGARGFFGPIPHTVRTRRVRWFNFISARRYHRIVQLHGTVWTLFVCGPVAQGWGFWMPGRGHVPWKQRLKERGIL